MMTDDRARVEGELREAYCIWVAVNDGKSPGLGAAFNAGFKAGQTRTPEPSARVEALRTKLRMIVSHATGGSSQDIDASVNAICVRITAYRNQIYEAGKQATPTSAAVLAEREQRLVEALRHVKTMLFDNHAPLLDVAAFINQAISEEG